MKLVFSILLLFSILLTGCGKVKMEGYKRMTTNNNYQQQVRAAAQHPNVQKFLNFIAKAEGTSDIGRGGYDVNFGGSTFDDFSAHPGVSRNFTQTNKKKNTTTAAGRYQFLKGTWNGVSKKMGLDDFSPASQDVGATYLLYERGALQDVIDGNTTSAIKKMGSTWASFPTSPHPQNKHSWGTVNKWLEGEGLPSATPASNVDMQPLDNFQTSVPNDALPKSSSSGDPGQPSPSTFMPQNDFLDDRPFLAQAAGPSIDNSALPQQQQVMPYTDVRTGQTAGAVPETMADYARLQNFADYDMNTRGSLINLEDQLSQAEQSIKRQLNLFDPYPTYFDDRLRKLIAEA